MRRSKFDVLLLWMTRIMGVVAFLEKTNHYVQIARKRHKKRNQPIGFQPKRESQAVKAVNRRRSVRFSDQ